MQDNYYNEIKTKLIDNELTKAVKRRSINKSDLTTYYEVGKILNDAGKHYGEGIIKKYSIKLTNELGKGYDITTLKRMRQFFIMVEKGARVGHQLSWSHIRELLPIKDIEEVNYYSDLITKLNLTRDELKKRIKSREYERLSLDTKKKLINKEELELKDTIPNPIVIYNPTNKEIIGEIALHKYIMENIQDFMKQLGEGYAFIGSEYKIKADNGYNNSIDFLLFNTKFICYVVVELKVTELRKEYIGQTEIYMNYIDNNLKQDYQNKTIGLIIVKEDNKFVLRYKSDSRIESREYIILN